VQPAIGARNNNKNCIVRLGVVAPFLYILGKKQEF
jgi:hypothetical protein